MTAAKQLITTMISVCAGTTCIGHILARGPKGYEAFDIDERTLGIYESQRLAADAIFAASEGQCHD
jgi:hypothetical protein